MNNYDLICQFEAMHLDKRFLPYSIGTPKKDYSRDDAYERANFVFITDCHTDFINAEESIDNVKRTVDYINNSQVNFDALICAGDIITPFKVQTKENPLSNAKAFFDIVKNSKAPVLFSKGNHDDNNWWNYPENTFGDKDWSNLFFDYAEENYGIVRQQKASGDKSTWNYYDINAKKIRVVCLDIQDTDKTATLEDGTSKYFGEHGYGYFTEEQMTWIANVALNFDDKEEKDWGVIFVFHQYPLEREAGDYENPCHKLVDICVAFNEGNTYKCNYVCESNPFFNLNINADFTRYKNEEKRPHMICWLLGHIHTDDYLNIKGINVIYSLNSSCTMRCGDSRVARIKGTSTQNSFSIFNIDTRERRIRIFRYGAGTNCYSEGGDRFLPDGLPY